MSLQSLDVMANMPPTHVARNLKNVLTVIVLPVRRLTAHVQLIWQPLRDEGLPVELKLNHAASSRRAYSAAQVTSLQLESSSM
jgi:hypothetical protein